MRYVFADCELDTQLYILRRAECTTRLRPKVFEVLRYLLEHRDRVVSKHELLEAVWPQHYISDATLADTIRLIRQAVGERARHAQVIQTRHGYGYRFIAKVTSALPAYIETPEPETWAIALSPPDPAPQAPGNFRYATGERKVVTVLCATLGQSAALLEQLGLDALHALMHTRYALLKRVMQQYGGTIQPLLGDQVLAVFGLPLTHEDHAQRAGLAALAGRAHLETHQEQSTATACPAALAIRMGLHTGWIAVEAMEQTAEPAPLLIGDALALAMTLQEHADPGTIICSATTARLLQDVAHIKEHPPLLLPEQPEPALVYTLLAPRYLPTLPARGQPLRPFVGRAVELATLQALAAQLHERRGHVVHIVGEPGIGKSRFLAEFRSTVRHLPLTYVASRCVSYDTTTPYGPVRDLLRQLCGLTATDSPEGIAHKVAGSLHDVQMDPDTFTPLLLHLLGQAVDTTSWITRTPQGRRQQTFATLLQLCMQSSQRRPLVLEVENLHWIDATSEAWLAALAERVAAWPILLLTTCRPGYRPTWLGASYVTQLALERLSAPQSMQVLQAVPKGAQLPTPVTQALLARADGNPFFIEELTQATVEHSLEQLPVIPETVQAVLAARIDRLPPTAKHLLQVAAVIGSDVPLPLLAAVAAVPPMALQQGLQHLQMAELLYETHLLPTPVYTFKHVLTQEVAYQSLLVSTRQPYHQQIAQRLAEGFPEIAALHPERLAHHYTEAGLLEQALPYWQCAGEQAIARSANVEAVSHFSKSLEVLQTLPVTMARHQRELQLQLALSAPLFMTKRPPAVERTYQRILALCQELNDPTQYGNGLAGLWQFLFNTGQFLKAREVGQQCMTLARQADNPAFLLEAHRILGSTYLFLGELHKAHAHLQHNTRPCQPQTASARTVYHVVDPGVVCHCRQAQTLWLLGYADQALSVMQQARHLARATAHPYSLVFTAYYMCIIHTCRREMDPLQEYAAAVVTLARKHEFVYFMAGGLYFQGIAMAAQGEATAGLAKMQEAMAFWDTLGSMHALSSFYVALADVYRQCSQINAGLQVLNDALHIVDTKAERYYEAEVYRQRGELLLHPTVHDAQQAEACFRRACAIAVEQGAKAWELRSVMSLSRLWHQQGKRQEARQCVAQLYGWFTEGFATPDVQDARALLDVLR